MVTVVSVYYIKSVPDKVELHQIVASATSVHLKEKEIQKNDCLKAESSKKELVS